ncbi:MarR family transcriptional regulator [Galactobacter sp.]|uniref:MarR family winged helix-turn-helix transcriptional regulator n=1 Tax=Galactobacter sp. TaxID=2676125 RepID=UPI0025C59DA5|nr:MarR family transcriptional regulator [Galactobacter sp.]
MSGEESDALEGDDLVAWSSLATVLEWLPAALDAQLTRDSQLTHFEFGVLYALNSAPAQTLKMSTLADYANSTLSRLSRAVARLERRGLVVRRPDPDDGRTTLAQLTDSGVQETRKALPGHVALVRRTVLDPLTAAQRRQLTEISRRIQQALREQPGWSPPAH